MSSTGLEFRKLSLPLERLFYINFEDNRLEGLTGKDLSEIVELYYKHNSDAELMYLFLDEVQNIPGWEKFVRRLLERKNVRVFITAHHQNCSRGKLRPP